MSINVHIASCSFILTVDTHFSSFVWCNLYLGVYFYYEMSPVQAVFEVKHKSFGYFVTTCCAILGGAYTVIGMMDGIIGGLLAKFMKTGTNGGLA